MSHLSVSGTGMVLNHVGTEPDRFRPGWQRRIIHTDKLMMVVLDIDNGPWAEPDPPHSHPHEQIAYIAQGDILFICDGAQPQRLIAGDVFAVPPNVKHTIQVLSKTARLVDTFHPIREDFIASAKK